MRLASIVFVIGIVLTASVETRAQSVPETCGYFAPDPTFVPIVKAPTYPRITDSQPGTGVTPVVEPAPVIGVDSGNADYYSLAGTCPLYLPFARLLAEDGVVVRDFSTTYEAGAAAYRTALDELDILVMASPNAASISPAEAAELADWVNDGGSLLLADNYSLDLSRALGMQDPPDMGDWSHEFTSCSSAPNDQGLLLDNHVITQGLSSTEEAKSVAVWNYGGMRMIPIHPGAVSILTLRPGSTEYCVGAACAGARSTAGYSRGLAFEHGAGKVYASANSQMFTALLYRTLVGYQKWKMDMAYFPPNQQFLLNIVHWLDGLLADSDADGVADSRDQCEWFPQVFVANETLVP